MEYNEAQCKEPFTKNKVFFILPDIELIYQSIIFENRWNLKKNDLIFFRFNNFDNIPANLTGCEKRCYCENGEVLCQVSQLGRLFSIGKNSYTIPA